MKLLDLPDDLVCEIFSRVPFADKQSTLPLVCKKVEAILLCATRPGLWGPLTPDFHKMKRKAGFDCTCSYNYLEDEGVFRSILWTASHSSATELVRVMASVDVQDEAAYLLRVLTMLTGSFAAAQYLPGLEVYLRGDHSAKFLNPSVFSSPHWASQVLPNIVSLQVVDFDLAVEHFGLMACLVGLQKLRVVDCFDAPDPAAFVETLSALSELRSLHLDSTTRLSGVIMASGTVTRLTELVLREFGPDDLRFMDLLTSLKCFCFDNCSLTELPASLCTLSQLQQLELGSNKLQHLPDCVSGLSGLRMLSLNNNRFTAFPDLQLAALTALEYLFIAYQEEVQEYNAANTHMAVLGPISCFSAMPGLKHVDMRQGSGYDLFSEVRVIDVMNRLRLDSVRGQRTCRPVILYQHFKVGTEVDADLSSHDYEDDYFLQL